MSQKVANAEKKVLFVVAYQGYQPAEYSVPKKLLEQAGIAVVTASDKPGFAIAKDGSSTQIDITLDKLNPNEYDGIVFIGGPGTLEHLDNTKSYTLIKQTVEAEKPLGAICIATRILAKAGVLKHKQATGWDGDNQLAHIYESYEIDYVNKDVMVDENIVTAVGPQAAQEFGQKILSLL